MPDNFDNTSIVISNLIKIAKPQSRLNELRALVLNELPVEDLSDADIAEVQKKYRRFLSASDSAITTDDRVSFCRRVIVAEDFDAGRMLFHPSSAPTHETVSYVANSYSSAAYDAIFRHTESISERICNSFSDLYADIDTGVCDCCILPVENTSDGKLLSFYSIIDRFDLKISMTYDVENSDGTQTTRYALLRRKLFKPSCMEDDCFFEFSFLSTEHLSVNTLLSAAELCRLRIYRINSIPLRYNESAFIFHPILRGELKDIITFSLFLSLNLSQYSILGIYYHIR